jgi:hypothetical protein
MVKFMKENSLTNIVIMEAPQTHGLSTLTRVNNDVKVFIRKLQKMMKTHNNMDIFLCGYKAGAFHSLWVAYEWNGKRKDGKENIRLSKKLLQERKEHPTPMGKSGGKAENRRKEGHFRDKENRSTIIRKMS